MQQLHSQSEAHSPNAYSSRGQLCKISQGLHERIDQGSVLPTLLGYAAEVENLKDSAFPFKVSNDPYLWMEEQIRQPLAFLADEVVDVMCYSAFVKEVNGHVENED